MALAFDMVPRSHPPQAAEPHQDLQLDVVINGAPANMIGSFMLFPGGLVGATRGELESLGLRPEPGAGDDVLLLNRIPSLHYQYDERAQRISITVDDAHRQANVIDLSRGAGTTVVRPETGWGAVLDYDLFGSFASQPGGPLLAFSGASLTLDARAFSPYGTFAQSAIVTAAAGGAAQAIRLGTSLRYSDPDALTSWTAGDTITGGLTWTRPIRIGGLQAARNFALRPDLVTMPLPNLGGTAAVPSTVDVYINSIKTFSQDVGAGPFNLTNIPMVTGAGNAVVVVRDSSGQATTTNIPFYGSAALLAAGLSSWSLEGGLPRLSYGAADDTYTGQAVASATWRQGLLDWFTAEGHAEGGGGVANGGGGGVVRIGPLGVLAAAVAGSTLGGARGLQGALSFEAQLAGVSLLLGTQHTFGDYEDLASATARLQTVSLTQVAGSGPNALPAAAAMQSRQQLYAAARAPTALDRITLGGPLPFDTGSSWDLSLVHEQDAAGNVSRLASVSYTRQLPWDASLFVTAYKDFAVRRSTGVLFGLTVALGGSIAASSTVSHASGGTVGGVQASRSLGPEPGSYGWEVQDAEGAAPYREAAAAYRSSVVTVRASANQSQAGRGATLDAAGAVAALGGGGVFLADRIDDAFAVVDAGAPGVAVSSENQSVGTSDASGMVLVPTLRSWQKNRISVDPTNLPADAELGATEQIVTPGDRAGALVAFAVHSDAAAALLVFVRPDGGFVPAGAAGRLAGGGAFVVGYDGQAFLRDLAPANRVTIDLGAATCEAAFAFTPRPGEQVRIGPVACR